VPADLRGEPGRDGKDGHDGVDGKDADPEAMRAAVAAAVAELPPAKDGRDGTDGRDGKDGVNGKDIDPDAVKELAAAIVAAMLPAAVAEAVAALPRAVDGKDGRDGIDGKGVDMLTLEATVRGLVAESVAAIPQPKDGRDGVDGKDGRSAIEIDVRRGLDPTRKYQPGEHVAYRGGVIRSYRQTDAMPEGAQLEDHGWHVVQNGIDDLAADWADDGRTVAIAIRMTDGTTTVKQLTVPLAIDRGVYDEATVYQRGDGVTWDGSWWIAQRAAATAEKPGASDAWRLAVRKGRNGRDGLKGEPGQRGAQGRDGVDRKW